MTLPPEDLARYIESLPIPPADPNDAVFGVRRTRGLDAGADGRPPATTVIDVGALLSFVDNIPAQQRQDVLDTVELAQRAATGLFDRHRETEQWYGKFTEVLERVGWVMSQFAFVKHDQEAGDLHVDKSALQVLAAFATQGALGILSESLKALENLADKAQEITLFDQFASTEGSGNFQIGVAELSKQGALSMALGAFHYRAAGRKTKVVFASWGARQVDFWSAAQRMTLNDRCFDDRARKAAHKILGDSSRYIMEIGPLR
jgi:hypothetical protein